MSARLLNLPRLRRLYLPAFLSLALLHIHFFPLSFVFSVSIFVCARVKEAYLAERRRQTLLLTVFLIRVFHPSARRARQVNNKGAPRLFFCLDTQHNQAASSHRGNSGATQLEQCDFCSALIACVIFFLLLLFLPDETLEELPVLLGSDCADCG